MSIFTKEKTLPEQDVTALLDMVPVVLDNAIRKLPRDQRNAVLLYVLGDYTEEEVIMWLGCSQRDVSRLLEAGIAKLKVLLEGHRKKFKKIR
jgi:DNA-directed RNA polymerase specialized sigma24 family protein